MALKSKEYFGIVKVSEPRTMKDAFSHPEPNVEKYVAYAMIGLTTQDGDIWFYSPKSKFRKEKFPEMRWVLDKSSWVYLNEGDLEPSINEDDRITIRAIPDKETKFGLKVKNVKLISFEPGGL